MICGRWREDIFLVVQCFCFLPDVLFFYGKKNPPPLLEGDFYLGQLSLSA